MTPTTAELERLAALCEAATGGSAEHDELGVRVNEALGIASYITDADHGTQSLDAAMTLVPKNVVGWRMDWSGLRAVVRMGFGGIPGIVEGWAATPALALCAASLRAIAATQEQPND